MCANSYKYRKIQKVHVHFKRSNMRSLFLVLCSLILHLRNVHCVSPTMRSTSNGPIEGIELTTSLRQPYYAFKGVRYAEAPITGTDPLSGQRVDRRFKV